MMTTALAARPAQPEPDRAPRRRQRTRPSRGDGRSVRPLAHPGRQAAPLPGRLPATTRARARACTVERPATRLRLTDRGVALVMVAGALVVAAALMVIALTAATVTGPDYLPYGHTALSR